MTRIWLAVLSLALAAPAAAVNVNVFKEAPISRLKGDELKAFVAVVYKTLDETPDGATVEWRAPKTRFVSKISPQRSFSDGKLRCREATVESDAHDRYQRGLYTFCKGAKGNWEFKTPATVSKMKKP